MDLGSPENTESNFVGGNDIKQLLWYGFVLIGSSYLLISYFLTKWRPIPGIPADNIEDNKLKEARERLQKQYEAAAREHAEKQKQLEERKREEKDNKKKLTSDDKKKPLKNTTDYNPLNPSAGLPSYRPARKTGCSGGGCGK